MKKIKTIADFKRAMQPGTFWKTTHKYIGRNPSSSKSLGIRECVLNNSVDFGFKSSTNYISHSAWPKKSEFSVNNDTIIIRKKDFCELQYTQIS